MRNHKRVVHNGYCPNERYCGYCPICDGDLFHCEVCNGAEGSLPTECPGVKMTAEQIDAVYAQDLDYCYGEWWAVQYYDPCIHCDGRGDSKCVGHLIK